MNSLRTLFDAFEELEVHADEAPGTDRDFVGSAHPSRRSSMRILAPTAAAAAVVLAAGTVVVWQQSSSSSGGGSPAAASSPIHSEPVASSHSPGHFVPPTSGAELAAKTRAILAGIATIKITYASGSASEPSPHSSAPNPASGGKVKVSGRPATPVLIVPGAPIADSGAAIVGTLTAGGETGGFDLDVFATTPPLKARCDGDASHCTVRRLDDGSSLATSSWHDRTVPGGMTYQIELVRSDGADILMHLSTEHDPKGQSTVTASHLPLSVHQLVEFVTSDRW